ncbi:hypothetical protein [Agromyces sp. Root81]|uniref:hypothetical protein n=1 Tax=Agromyces sp. Root81 TaxID=1736601 RepID=UPI0012F9FEA3|nr:hypothetical protein [Agromyces sp. Root81]
MEFELDDIQPAAEMDEPWARTFPLGRALFAEVRANGWEPIAVSCTAPDHPGARGELGTIEISATKRIDDHDAISTIWVGAGDHAGEIVAARGEAAVPFHTESPDPWGAVPLDGPTCLDTDAPPAKTVSSGAAPQDLSTVRAD